MRYRVSILGRESIADKTISLSLTRPPGFKFSPGQNIDVALENHAEVDPNDGPRIFSIASAPHENHLLIAARLRDNPYKRALNTIPIDGTLLIDGPFGTFRLHENESIPAVLIAGGIGITPCLSILRHAARERSDRELYLFFSNRARADVIFLEELALMGSRLPRYTFVPTLTRDNGIGLNGMFEKGYVDLDMLKRHIGDLSAPRYYVVGPSRMVWGTVQRLDGMVDRDRILVEDFTGF